MADTKKPWESLPDVDEGGNIIPPAGTAPSAWDKIQSVLRQIVQAKAPDALMMAAGPVGSLVKAGGGTLEGTMDLAPMVAGTVGAVAGAGAPGAALGVGAAEAGRQLIRRALGLPQAPGVVQKFLHLDPDSSAAAAAGIGAEAAVTPIAEGVGKGVGALAEATDNGALRRLASLLGVATDVDKAHAMDLASRMRDLGIAPARSNRKEILANAERALGSVPIGPPGGAIKDMMEAMDAARATGKEVPATSVVDKALAAIPKNIQGAPGQPSIVPLVGTNVRNAAENSAIDTMNAVRGRSTVPVDEAIAEKTRQDALLRSFYKTGRENVPEAKEFTQIGADAWRHNIHQAFPDLGLKQAKVSDLIDITELLKDANKEATRTGLLGADRTHNPFSLAMKYAHAGISTGPFVTMSSAAKTILAKVLAGGAQSVQAWMRAADLMNINSPVPHGLGEDINGIVSSAAPAPAPSPSPTPSVSEDDFVKKYQQ